ncbi:hypothetical protein HII13_001024 [Brettanomyces bruxellensis]|nr:hypothetical protein HII13_001024 [Brettanomyces bruxellensis]
MSLIEEKQQANTSKNTGVYKFSDTNLANNSSHSLLSQQNQPGLYSNSNYSNNSFRRYNGGDSARPESRSPNRRVQKQKGQNINSKHHLHHLHRQQQYNEVNQENSRHARTKKEEKLPLFMCEPFVRTALVKGSYKTIVQLPKYVDYYEWLALNTFEFFNHINKFYGIIAEYVTPDKYPKMMADSNTEYIWMMPNGKTASLPANQYIEYALTWMSNKINDQTIFPTKAGIAFPPSFLNDIRGICRQIFRMMAHIYWNHFDKLVHLSLEAHWSSYFSHFISFVREFDLIEPKELEPLAGLISVLEDQGKIIKVDHPQRPPPASICC